METKKSTSYKILTWVGRILLILLIFAGVGLYLFADDYYRPSATATEAMESTDNITFTQEEKSRKKLTVI